MIHTLLLCVATSPAWANLPSADDPIVRPPHPRAEEANRDDRFTTNRDGRWLDLPEEDETFTFVVFGDRTGGPAEGIAVLEQAVEEANLFEPDLVMTVGDLIQGYSGVDPWMTEMQEYRDTMAGLLCPWFPVAGNHDVYWRGPDRPAEEHEGRYEEHFGPLWYAFDHKDCRFIALYTDEPNPETGERNFGKAECQRMSPEQFAWLERTLEEAKDKRHVFCFLHHPRWIGGRYGDDWERVHELLAAAGNVRAVFAGHIHHMRYEGPRDGIEYVVLATVGGGQAGYVPEAGWLHQFHHVTVRPDGMAMAAVPVGTTIDVRAITPDVSLGAARLAGARPQAEGELVVRSEAGSGGEVTFRFENPTRLPIEVEMVPGSEDPRWSFAPDHVHAVIGPGESHEFPFEATSEAPIDRDWKAPVATLSCDLLAPARRYPMVPKSIDFPLRPEFTAPSTAVDGERAMFFDGVDDAVLVPHDAYRMPDGPLTIEAWFQGNDFEDRIGLATRTEGSEFGLFVSDGRPDFSIHLGGRYAIVRGEIGMLEPGRRHHLAGVFDGAEVRLYLDGRLIGAEAASGSRTTNTLPFIVGGDVRSNGRPMSFFNGWIDGVRLSSTARYSGDRVEIDRRHATDDDTVLLLDFDERVGPFVRDGSASEAHGACEGGPALVKVD